jgi:5,10-methylene-tetrahydrofolate dehydrogenase/methenyl tetrahydrofolate cyclohydrolase
VDSHPLFYKQHSEWASPQLHILNVGLHDASLSYIKKKMSEASSAGIKFQLHQFLEKGEQEQTLFGKFEDMVRHSSANSFQVKEFESSEPVRCFEEVHAVIKELNERKEVSGILMQLPLKPSIHDYTRELINAIHRHKDVDCLTIHNRSKVIEHERPNLMPCTPSGVIKILD